MMDLAGNAMALPVVLALLQCLFTAVSWKSASAIRAARDSPVAQEQARSCSHRWFGCSNGAGVAKNFLRNTQAR